LPHSTNQRLKDYIYHEIETWASNYPGLKNIPLECFFTMGKICDRNVSHRTASEFCGLDMIGGVSPLPQFLYGKKPLPNERMELIADYFSRSIDPQSFSTDELMAKAIDQAISKIMKHRYVNPLLYACIQHVESLGMHVDNPSKPMIKIGNGVVEHLIGQGVKFSTEVAMTSFSFSASSPCQKDENLFLVISAYQATHKHKEYPARWRLANCSFENGKAKWNKDINSLTIILDGLWSDLYDDHLAALSAFMLPGVKLVTDVDSWISQ
jgi:hypothetical protein